MWVPLSPSLLRKELRALQLATSVYQLQTQIENTFLGKGKGSLSSYCKDALGVRPLSVSVALGNLKNTHHFGRYSGRPVCREGQPQHGKSVASQDRSIWGKQRPRRWGWEGLRREDLLKGKSHSRGSVTPSTHIPSFSSSTNAQNLSLSNPTWSFWKGETKS